MQFSSNGWTDCKNVSTSMKTASDDLRKIRGENPVDSVDSALLHLVGHPICITTLSEPHQKIDHCRM
jgi:hypothetical protein